MDKREEIYNTSSSEDEEVIISLQKDNDENKTGLYIIYSRWSLSRIDRELSSFGKIGLLRIICDGGKETNRTLALLEDDVYNKLSAKGYADKKMNKGFSIAKFNEKALELPSKGCNRNLFVCVPEIFRKDDLKTIDIIDDKLKHLVEWDILPKDSWHVNALLKSREKGSISSGCFIVFDNDVSITTIAKVKILITDNFWPSISLDIEREQFKCLWAFDSSKKKDRKEKDDGKKTRRKIKLEGEDGDDKALTQKVKSENKDVKRKIKSEEIEEEEIVASMKLPMPIVSQPVEILDDIVEQ